MPKPDAWSRRKQVNYCITRPPRQQTFDHAGTYHPRLRLKSKYRGVRWEQSRNRSGNWGRGKWAAHIMVDGKCYRFPGRFEDEETAARAYDVMAKTLLGDAATPRLNFPNESRREGSHVGDQTAQP